jgi:hypothetical protein
VRKTGDGENRNELDFNVRHSVGIEESVFDVRQSSSCSIAHRRCLVSRHLRGVALWSRKGGQGVLGNREAFSMVGHMIVS